MEQWKKIKLGDVILDLIGGGTPSTKEENYWNGDIPWMTSAHITSKEIFTGQRKISESGLKESATKLIPKNNLLIASRVGIGKAAINRIDVAISQDLTGVVLDRSRILPEYVYWWLALNQNKLKSLAQGSTIKGILKEDLAKLELELPALNTQKEISDILNLADEAIQKAGDTIAHTERLKSGLMQKLLTEGIGHTEFNETKIGRIPKEWEVKEIKKLGKVVTGKTPLTNKAEYWNGDIPFITPGDVSDRKYIVETERTVSKEGVKNTTTLLPQNTFIVVCIGSTIGKSALTTKECITNQQINSVIVDQTKYDAHYVYYAFSRISKQFKSHSGTAAVPIIKKSLFEKYLLPIPPLDEQRNISRIFSVIDEKIIFMNNRKNKYERIKKALMNDLLTGKKRVALN